MVILWRRWLRWIMRVFLWGWLWWIRRRRWWKVGLRLRNLKVAK